MIQKNLYGVVGPIIGVTGVMLGLSKQRDIPAVSLLVETFSHPMYLGIKGAKEILRVIDTKFKYNIDLKKMSKEITQVEKEIMKKIKEMKKDLEQSKELRIVFSKKKELQTQIDMLRTEAERVHANIQKNADETNFGFEFETKDTAIWKDDKIATI